MQSVFRGRAFTILTNHLHGIDQVLTISEKLLDTLYETTTKFLKDLVLLEAEKGNTTIAIYGSNYNTKMNKTIKDKSKCKQLDEHPTMKLQERNNSIVTQLSKDKYIDKKPKLF